MWRDYFPNAQISGIELNKRWYLSGEERIKVFLGNQMDKEFLATVVAETGPIDVVIDDGAHTSETVVKSLECLLPEVVPGGLYFIEDLVVLRINDRRQVRHAKRPIEQSVWDVCGGVAKHCASLGKGQVQFVHYMPGMIVIKK